MKKHHKIVFVGFLQGFGGAEKSMINIANGLAARGEEVTIISLKDNNVVYEINNDINYVFIPDHGGFKVNKKINRFLDLKKKLAEIKPDLVISFWTQPAIFAAILSKFGGFKNIYSERGDPSDKEYRGMLKVMRTIFFKYVDGFVFQTQGAQKCFSESIQVKSTIINNPVYIRYGEVIVPKQRRKAVVNVGRLHNQKNQKVLIEAFHRISSSFPQYTLEIYGDGPLKDDLHIQIKKLRLTDKVILKGTTKQLFNEIKDASIFVLSSDYEGMPNALMEAMALGIPSISTDCKPGGAREIVENGKNGLIVKRNSIDELAKAIKYMIEHTEKAEEMGRTARKICNTHSIDAIINKWQEYIKQIIK